MTLAFFLPNLDGGGAERNTLRLARGLRAVGHPVSVIAARAKGPPRDADGGANAGHLVVVHRWARSGAVSGRRLHVPQMLALGLEGECSSSPCVQSCSFSAYLMTPFRLAILGTQ